MTAQNEEMTRAFETRELDPSGFRHGDHVAVAYQMLRKYDFMEATLKYGESLNAIATKAGAADKFNTTITLAFMSLIAERMAGDGDCGYQDFIARNPDLLSKNILSRWYSPKRLKSDQARRIFLMPDKLEESPRPAEPVGGPG